ncbi:MAG TPA: methyltransferase [Verrucomicrobiae bacterium]|jgi:ubiquinone/menaquinone biosynthesis C-methylase UbiE|nr:methyltransferase [Verrucomicrobiae bacterium]
MFARLDEPENDDDDEGDPTPPRLRWAGNDSPLPVPTVAITIAAAIITGMAAKKKITPERIMQFAWGYAPTLAIEAAVKHGIFDRLDKGPQTAEQIASKTGTSLRGVNAIVDLLVSIQLLQRKGKRLALTPESANFLVSTKPGFYGTFFRHISDQLLPKWLQLTEIVKTGRPAMRVNSQDEGAEFFAKFVESLFPLSFPAASALGKHLGIGKSRKPVSVLDIGAGSGVWGIGLAKQSPRVRIHAVDWPRVLEVTRRVAGKHGLEDRLTTASGDFFEADFGSGHQVATIGHILHSEGRDRSRRLLKKVFDALAPGGTVAVQEFVADDDRNGPPSALIFAVNMLINTEAGDAFTFKEMSGWLREAGFKNPRLLKVPSVSPLVLADRPK